MGLKEEADLLRQQIAAAKEQEEELENETSQEEVEEEKVEEKQPEESQEEKKEEEEPKKKTNADYARERRERVEAKRLQEELEAANARIAALEASQKKPEQIVDEEPDKETDPLGWADWRARQADKKAEEAQKLAQSVQEKIEKEERIKQREEVYSQAQKELINYENDFKKSNTDYEDVKNYYIGMMAMGIKTLNPSISNEDLGKAVTAQIVMRASNYLNQGWENPVEAIYQEARSMGYQPKTEEEKKSPDLAKLAKNMERNSGMAGASSGGGKGELTKRYAATEMTAQEWARLPKADRERLMKGLA